MKALGWIVAGLLAVALFWLWTANVGSLALSVDRNNELKRENDSLAQSTRARDARIKVLIAELDTMQAERDTAWAHVAPSETLYLGHRAQAASLSYRRKWHDMGVLPRDSTAARHP